MTHIQPLTFKNVRDIVYDDLRAMFPHETILDTGDKSRFKEQDYAYVDLPMVAYSLRYELALPRVTDAVTTKDLVSMTGEVEQLVPYDVILNVSCHGRLQEDAEDMALRVHRAWGRAPCIGGIGFHIDDVYHTGAAGFGVYSHHFRWVGWFRIAGPLFEAPLVTEVRTNVHGGVPGTETNLDDTMVVDEDTEGVEAPETPDES